MIDLLRKLTMTSGVSGNEENIASLISEEIKPFVDEIRKDNIGNLICIKNGNGKKIMFAAHMDEIGVIISHIEDNGFIRFSAIGGIKHFHSLGQRVMFENGMFGVIGCDDDLEDLKDLKINNMFIDVGLKSKSEVEEKFKIGDTAAFVGNFEVSGEMILSKALDDRAGCLILIELAKTLNNTNHEIYFVFTTQEEVGLRGAKPAAYSINPDYALAIDVTAGGDIPKAKNIPVKCGNGPIIKVMDRASIIHPKIKELLVNCAEDLKIGYQLKVTNVGGTDAGVISLAREGIPTGNLAVPCRYLHTQGEMINIKDIESLINILKEFVDKIN